MYIELINDIGLSAAKLGLVYQRQPAWLHALPAVGQKLGLNYAVRGLGRSNAIAEVLVDGPAAGAVEALVDVK